MASSRPVVGLVRGIMHQIDIPGWMTERAKLSVAWSASQPKKTALLVIDMQKAFVADSPLVVPCAREIVPNVNRLSAALRAAGGLVVFTRHSISSEDRFVLPAWMRNSPLYSGAAAYLTPGHPAHDLCDALEVGDEDWVLDKHRYSAFLPNSSDLHSRLQARGVDTVIVTGTLTNMCCESSARDASMLDYKVFFVSDATAAQTDEEHNATLLNLGWALVAVRQTTEIVGSLGAPK